MCHKVTYIRKKDAEQSANAMPRRLSVCGRHMYVYQCWNCGHWHITRRPQKPWEQRRSKT